MPTELQPAIDAATTTVTSDQLALVKATMAQGATDAELKLYLYDCARRRVHPLDRLLHFTKRGGKYAPVTSIDLMRTRAADTGEYAGSDDAVFTDDGCSSGIRMIQTATVTVYRLVQGQKCSFTATARWAEYYPGDGPQGMMWRKMPHTMLAKCAEALALRKGFPQQLAGLYAAEELDQADDQPIEPPREPLEPVAAVPDTLPSADLMILKVQVKDTKKHGVKRYTIFFNDGRRGATIKDLLGTLAHECWQQRIPVRAELKDTKWGPELVKLERADLPDPEPDMLTDADIPF